VIILVFFVTVFRSVRQTKLAVRQLLGAHNSLSYRIMFAS